MEGGHDLDEGQQQLEGLGLSMRWMED